MPSVIDLRSDTVTQPTPRMMEAIFRAELGDDVYGEDPTVNRLQRLAAEKLGKEAALFVASGTMGNLVAVLTHCNRGDEMLVGDQAHVFYYEVGGSAALGGVHVRTVPNGRGIPSPEDVEAAIRGEDLHFPRTKLVCLENTHNRCGGVAVSAEETNAVAAVAHRYGVKIHLDGARLFNAAVALGVAPSQLAEQCDSVDVCLSKGLSAPVGSILAGSGDFIANARKYRKMVGGGMRQVGILAGAGIVALTEMVDRLAEDHTNARVLAEAIASMEGTQVDLAAVQTNIVVVCIERPDMTAAQFIARMAELGVKITPFGGNKVRLVTHYGIEREQVERTIEVAGMVLGVG
jgi:threonine aldolase